MKRSTHFARIGSPLDGKRIPRDWRASNLTGKRKALVAAGLAAKFSTASRLLSAHGRAVKRFRSEKADRETI